MSNKLWPLALLTFAVGTDTFILVGLLGDIASELNVSATTAAQLITCFSITYAVSAPILGMVLRPHLALRAGTAVFILGNALTALAPTFGFAIAARILTALGASILTPSAIAITAAIAPEEQRGRALSFVINGLMSATALGVPVGLLLGAANWRHTIWLLVALGSIALLAIIIAVPSVKLDTRSIPRPSWPAFIILLTTIIVLSANMQIFTYASQITNTTGTALIIYLTCFGVFTIAGNSIAGRLTDRYGALNTVLLCITGLLVTLCAAPLLPPVLFLSIDGFFSGMLTVPQQARIVALNPLLLGLLSASVYIGFAGAGATGKVVIDNLGASSVTWIAAALLVLPLGANLVIAKKSLL